MTHTETRSRIIRDECFQCLQQLQAIKKGTVALMSGNALEQLREGEAAADSSLEPESSEVDAPSDKKNSLPIQPEAPKSAVLSPVEAVTSSTDSAAPSSAVAAPSVPVAIARRIPEKDALLDEYEVIIDEVVPFR